MVTAVFTIVRRSPGVMASSAIEKLIGPDRMISLNVKLNVSF